MAVEVEKHQHDVMLRVETEKTLRELVKAVEELNLRLSGQWERNYLRVIKDLVHDAEECHIVLNRREGSAIENGRKVLGKFE